MKTLPALILAVGFIVAAVLVYKAAATGAKSATQAADEAARFRAGISSSPLGKYIISPETLQGGRGS